MHGTGMVFLVVVPILAGLGNFLVPADDRRAGHGLPAAERALLLALRLRAGSIFCFSFLAHGRRREHRLDGLPAALVAAPGNGQDLWILSLHILSSRRWSARSTSSSRSTTCARRGMSWMRIPLFVWSIEIYAWLLAARAARALGRRDDAPARPPVPGHVPLLRPGHRPGGSPVLYQHVFWFFGHPEVYIMILPAMGIISEILPVFARKPIFGYKAIALSTVAIGFFSMLVWAHHMFTVGLPTYLNIFFMLASMVIAIPTGMKIFNWLATLWRGNISLDTPMLFALGFLAIFTIGGLSGIYLAAFPVDWQVHGHVLRRRALPLRALRRLDLRDPRRPLLLVAEDLRPHARRAAREMDVLARLRRLQRDVLPAAPARPAGHGAARSTPTATTGSGRGTT